jgi:uncharacterized protein YndB with AHSA1/START domain
MKVATETLIMAPPDKVWKVLSDFSSYPEWNRFLKSVRGEIALNGKLEIDIQYYGKSVEKKIGTVTGFIPPKYFSWVWTHGLGTWYLSTEHVFRLKDKENGSCIFFQELYITGLGLRFRRRDMEHMARLSLEKFNDDLKDRLN